MTRATRWIIAALFGLAMTAVDCARTPPRHTVGAEETAVASDLVVHAFETQMETRLIVIDVANALDIQPPG